MASRMRWLSPPERVAALRPRVRYSSPTDCKKPSRLRISRKIWPAMSCCWGVRVRCSMKSSSWLMLFWQKSWMDRPPTVTASTSRRSRLPPQVGQGELLMHSSSSRLTPSDWVSR